MSNKLFFSLALALLILNVLAAAFVRPFSDPTRRTNAVLLNSALTDELKRLKTAIPQGCESPLIRDAILFGERDKSLSSSLAPNLMPAASRAEPYGQYMKPMALAASLDAAVVSVIGKNTFAAGFFVGPDLVVTSREAIEGDESDAILITSTTMKQVLKAEIISKSNTDNGSGKQFDFVLLRLPTGFKAPATLSVAGVASPSATIIAAGIPEHAYDPGKRRAAISNGNASEATATILSPGKISAVQVQKNGMKLLIHTADTGAGHAGGPLTDRCGRVVGMNTFEQTKNKNDYRILYALSAENLIEFLRSSGVSYSMAPDACVSER
jgi:hypothetical protein